MNITINIFFVLRVMWLGLGIYKWTLEIYKENYILLDVDSTFDQYKKYTIGKYHRVNIKCTYYLSLDRISMIS